jgi:hypothetical protein
VRGDIFPVQLALCSGRNNSKELLEHTSRHRNQAQEIRIEKQTVLEAHGI